MSKLGQLSPADRFHHLKVAIGYLPLAISQEEQCSSLGRLAQSWLEHLLDMQKVTRSSRVPPIYKGVERTAYRVNRSTLSI
jgi:hypothetical protein